MDALDQKLLSVFDGKVVRKDLLHRIQRHQRADLCAGIFAGALLCQ